MAKLLYNVPNEMNICEIDWDIRHYIEINGSENFDELISHDKRWEVFFNLSQMRTSLVNWYEFVEGASLLEIGGGFGALTGIFCDNCDKVVVQETSAYRAESICLRYKNRENLTVYASQLDKIEEEEKFDYIILIGGLEFIGGPGKQIKDYAKYLNGLQRRLKDTGRLLLAVDNRYGIRYFCGAPERHTGKPFQGINQYPDGLPGWTFSHSELISIIEEAGFSYHKFYYPLPDYTIPQLIYSEDYLPQKDVCERLAFYYENNSSLVIEERKLYEDIVDNKVFEFFANSFFVECGWEPSGCSVIYGALTTDRQPECAFATTIHNDGLVKKKALFQEGLANVENVYKNILDLRFRGIEVVPHQRIKRGVVMPFIHNMTLSDYLRSTVKDNPSQFVELIDCLYQQILLSSDIVNAEKNAMVEEGCRNLDFGPVLEKAYIDMVPFNCFYANGKLIFFDQEFTRNNYPAKYVLYRALKYTYLSIPFAEDFVPIANLKQKYGVEQLWSSFEFEEERFVSSNRRYEIYQNFYAWTWIDEQQINHNAEKLLRG